MKIKYTLDKMIEFDELCEIACMMKRLGYKTDNYIFNSDDDYIYFKNGDKAIIIDNYDITFSGHTPEEALEQYKNIIDKITN